MIEHGNRVENLLNIVLPHLLDTSSAPALPETLSRLNKHARRLVRMMRGGTVELVLQGEVRTSQERLPVDRNELTSKHDRADLGVNEQEPEGEVHSNVDMHRGGKVECNFWDAEKGQVKVVPVEDVTEEDYIRFRRIIIRPPTAQEIALRTVQKEPQTLSLRDASTIPVRMPGTGKEAQNEQLLRFLRGIRGARTMSRDAEIKRAKGQVAGDTNLKNKLDERRDLAVDLGSWTGMSNEVWQAVVSLPDLSSLDLACPPLPLPNVLRPVEVGTNPSSGGRYTPFFIKPLVWHENEVEHVKGGIAGTDWSREDVVDGDRGLGKGLKRLRLDNLSQIGTKNLANHLCNLSETVPAAPLVELAVHTLFLDSTLCNAIAAIGSCGVLQTLTLGTRGTKLSTAAVKEIVEGCVGLTSLELDGVEGRLAKTLWKDIEEYPEGLKAFRAAIPESGTHHSWTLDHLSSLPHLPIERLSILELTRSIPVAAAMPFLPALKNTDTSIQTPKVNDLCRSQPIPEEIYQAILDKGNALTTLNLDWWEIDEERLTKLVKTLPELEELTVRLDFPMYRLVTATVFPSTSKLERLRVSLVPKVDLCWEMDATKVCGRTTKMAPLNKAAAKPDVSESTLETLPIELAEVLQAPDSTIPASKEIKKFARKLPRLERLEWIGREGKGSWNVFKPSAEKKGGLMTVEFEHSGLRYLDQWSELSTGPVEILNGDEQDVPVSDVPPPATPSTSVFSPGPSNLQLLSPMTNGSSIPSEDIDTPLARWQSSRSSSFPCLGGSWPEEDREDGGWDALGLQDISPSPLSNALAKARRSNKSKASTSPEQVKSTNTTRSSSASLAKKPSPPRAETGPSTTEAPPRRRGRRGGVGRSRGSTSTATAETTQEATKAASMTSSPDGWMTVAAKKTKESAKSSRTGGPAGNARKAKK